MIRPFLCALSFLTIIPIPKSIQFSEKNFKDSVIFLPVVALLITPIVTCPFFLGEFMKRHQFFSAGIMLLLWVMVTGALHLDGFCDSVDGFSGGQDKKSILKIMSDGRIGAKGSVALFLLMLFKFIFLAYAAGIGRWLIVGVSLVLGRWMMALALCFGEYAKPEGLGKRFSMAGRLHGIVCSVFALAALLVLSLFLSTWQWAIGFPVLLASAITWAWYRYCRKRIGGMTGDTLGALCEMVEVVALLPIVYL